MSYLFFSINMLRNILNLAGIFVGIVIPRDEMGLAVGIVSHLEEF